LTTDVDMIHGKYGQFQVLVDDKVVLDGGALAFLSVLPSTRQAVEAVKSALSA
jgi:hypothetical protein